ncbi:MAG: DUF1292 domain-containing protein [Clostridia bacterium]|nr:DUF1292 domain-containing protein [Clostridia bacterium]
MSNEEKITNENDDFNEADLVSLLDDEGNEYEFEVLDEIDYEDGHYYALMPLFDLPDQEIESGSTYMIFEAVESEDGEPQLAEIDNEELLDEIAAVFESNFDSMEQE